MNLHYFELPKLPELVNAENGTDLWLALFKAETEEDLKKLEVLEVPVMKQAIEAYHSITATPEFREIERLRSKARHDEAQALRKARQEATKIATKIEREKWQNIVADKDAKLADKDVIIANLRSRLGKSAE